MDNINFQINRLKDLIKYCNDHPDLLELEGMAFVKKVMDLMDEVPHIYTKPAAPKSTAEPEKPKEDVKVEEEEEKSEPESDVELDMEGVIEPDTDDTPQPMGDPNKSPTEEEMDEANDCRSKAAHAFSEQKFQESIDFYTKAIELNPGNALYHAKRGQAYLKLKKPNKCIKDCDKALELNCDSAASYKYRGRAYRLLGNWEAAAKDLRQACKLDFDEEADEWLKEVTPNAKKLEQHKLKQERKKTEKEIKAREARRKAAQAAHEAAASANNGSANNTEQPEFDINNFMQFMDPEVSAAFKDIMANPMNIMKYQNNPKVMNILSKLGAAAGAGGGFPGGFPGAGGFPGFPGGFPGAANPPPQAPPKQTDFTDDMD